MTKKHILEIGLFVLVGVIFLGGVMGILLKKNIPLTKNEVASETQAKPQATTQNDEFASWKTYHSEKYGLEFRYPSEWKFEEKETTKTNALGVASTDLRFYKESTQTFTDGRFVRNDHLLAVSITPAQYKYRSEGLGDDARYSGEDDRTSCANYTGYWSFLCVPLTISGGKGISRYAISVPPEAGGAVYLGKSVLIQHTTHSYKGIVFGIGMINSCHGSTFTSYRDCIGPNAQNSSIYGIESEENIKEFFRYTQEKMKSGTLNPETEESVRTFDKIVSTVKLLD